MTEEQVREKRGEEKYQQKNPTSEEVKRITLSPLELLEEQWREEKEDILEEGTISEKEEESKEQIKEKITSFIEQHMGQPVKEATEDPSPIEENDEEEKSSGNQQPVQAAIKPNHSLDQQQQKLEKEEKGEEIERESKEEIRNKITTFLEKNIGEDKEGEEEKDQQSVKVTVETPPSPTQEQVPEEKDPPDSHFVQIKKKVDTHDTPQLQEIEKEGNVETEELKEDNNKKVENEKKIDKLMELLEKEKSSINKNQDDNVHTLEKHQKPIEKESKTVEGQYQKKTSKIDSFIEKYLHESEEKDNEGLTEEQKEEKGEKNDKDDTQPVQVAIKSDHSLDKQQQELEREDKEKSQQKDEENKGESQAVQVAIKTENKLRETKKEKSSIEEHSQQKIADKEGKLEIKGKKQESEDNINQEQLKDDLVIDKERPVISIAKKITLMKNPKTKEYGERGITLVNKVTVKEIEERLGKKKEGGYVLASISKENSEKVITDILKISRDKNKDRLMFTQAHYNTLKYKPGEKVQYTIHKVFSPEEKNVLKSPLKFPCRFTSQNEYSYNVCPSEHIRKLMGMDKSRYVKWKVNDAESISELNPNKQFSIPKNIFGDDQPKKFYNELTIIDPNVTRDEYLEMKDEVSKRFREENLLEFEKIFRIELEGKASLDKPKLMKCVLDRVPNEKFSIEKLVHEKSVEYNNINHKLSSGEIIPNKQCQPDAFSVGKELKPIEEKAKRKDGYLDRRDKEQIERFHKSGLKIILFTSLLEEKVDNEVRFFIDKLYAYETVLDIIEQCPEEECPDKEAVLKAWKIIGDKWAGNYADLYKT